MLAAAVVAAAAKEAVVVALWRRLLLLLLVLEVIPCWVFHSSSCNLDILRASLRNTPKCPQKELR